MALKTRINIAYRVHSGRVLPGLGGVRIHDVGHDRQDAANDNSPS
jgi:hypothetical protein